MDSATIDSILLYGDQLGSNVLIHRDVSDTGTFSIPDLPPLAKTLNGVHTYSTDYKSYFQGYIFYSDNAVMHF